MLRRSCCSLLLVLLSCAPYQVAPHYLGFTTGTSGAPPAPQVAFARPPSLTAVAGTPVVVVENSSYDVFSYGSYLYLSTGGYWFCARGYDEPFSVCDVRSVPRAVLTVPGNYWRHRTALGS